MVVEEGSLSSTPGDRREYYRRYYQEHREEILVKRAAHYRANRERIAIKRAPQHRRYWHRVGFLKRLNRIVTQQLARYS